MQCLKILNMVEDANEKVTKVKTDSSLSSVLITSYFVKYKISHVLKAVDIVSAQFFCYVFAITIKSI